MNNYDKIRFERKEESCNKILEAAVKCFGKKGYEKTSIKDIAELAGVSHGLIGKYFKSKENLLSETYIYVTKNTYPLPDGNLVLKDRIELLISQSAQIMINKKEYFDFFQMLLSSSDLPEEYKNTRKELFINAPIYIIIEEWKKIRSLNDFDSYTCFIQFLRTVYTILNLYNNLSSIQYNNRITPHIILTSITNSIEEEISNLKTTN